MRVLLAQRRRRPAIGAARIGGPPIGIEGVAIDYVVTSGRAAAGRALPTFAEMPCSRQRGMRRFAAGAAAGYVAQAMGQSTIGQDGNDAVAASFAAAAAAYARADATAASDVVAPMPAARLSV